MPTGQRYERLADGQIWRYFERSTGETVHVRAPVNFYSDFVQGAPSGVMVNGTPFHAIDANDATQVTLVATDEPNGVMQLALTNADEDQTAAVSFSDLVSLHMGSTTVTTRYLQFECRLKMKVLPEADTAAGGEESEVFWGLGSAIDRTGVSIAQRMGFYILGTGTGLGAISITTDDNVTDSGAIASGTTATADDQYRIYRVDASQGLDSTVGVKFYIDGARVASGTIFSMAGLLANVDAFQPIVQVSKEYTGANDALGTIELDYVRCWSIR